MGQAPPYKTDTPRGKGFYMKSNKGEQVFSGSTDDILADKIIRHSEINSSKEESTIPQHENSEPSYRCPLSATQCVTVIMVVLSSFFLLFMLLNRTKRTGKN